MVYREKCSFNDAVEVPFHRDFHVYDANHDCAIQDPVQIRPHKEEQEREED